MLKEDISVSKGY